MEKSKNLSETIGEGEKEGMINGKKELREFVELFPEVIEETRNEIYSLLVNKEGKSRWSHQEIAEKLIEAGQGWKVATNLEKFSGLNYKKIADKLIKAGEGGAVAMYLENFPGLNHNEIAYKLIEAGQGGAVAEYLEKFPGLIANALIMDGEGGAVADNLEKFPGLDKEIVLRLLNDIDQEAQITTARYFIKKDLRKEKELKTAEGVLVLEILKTLEMDFYVLLSECWAGKTTTGIMKKNTLILK